jgi:hypothetical protein
LSVDQAKKLLGFVGRVLANEIVLFSKATFEPVPQNQVFQEVNKD